MSSRLHSHNLCVVFVIVRTSQRLRHTTTVGTAHTAAAVVVVAWAARNCRNRTHCPIDNKRIHCTRCTEFVAWFLCVYILLWIWSYVMVANYCRQHTHITTDTDACNELASARSHKTHHTATRITCVMDAFNNRIIVQLKSKHVLESIANCSILYFIFLFFVSFVSSLQITWRKNKMENFYQPFSRSRSKHSWEEKTPSICRQIAMMLIVVAAANGAIETWIFAKLSSNRCSGHTKKKSNKKREKHAQCALYVNWNCFMPGQ